MGVPYDELCKRYGIEIDPTFIKSCESFSKNPEIDDTMNVIDNLIEDLNGQLSVEKTGQTLVPAQQEVSPEEEQEVKEEQPSVVTSPAVVESIVASERQVEDSLNDSLDMSRELAVELM